MSHILIIHLFVDRIVGWTHSLVLGTSTAIHKDVQVTLWYTAPGGRQLAHTAVLYSSFEGFLHWSPQWWDQSTPPSERIRLPALSPPLRSHQHLLLLFILLEDADIVFTIGFYFLKCYTLIGCVCVHVCTLGYMCGGRRTTVGSQGLVSGCQVWELRASACWAMSGFLYLPSVTLLPPPLRLVYRQAAHTSP